jgi:AcrR family transcriptional regulator
MSVRERLVEAAGYRFVEDGTIQARLEDIRRDAGVSVGALYHHFPDKETLHTEAWLSALADYQSGYLQVLDQSEDAQQGVKDVVAHQLLWVAENRPAAALLYGARPSGSKASERLSAQNRGFFKRVLAWWRIHAHYGAVRDDLDPSLLQALWLGPTDNYCRHFLEGHIRKLPPAAGRQLADAAWATLKGGDR